MRFDAMLDTRRTIRDANRLGVRFLLIDLGLALTFLNIASTSVNLETTQRNWKNARKAHDAIFHLLGRLTTTDEELQFIKKELSALRLKLEAAGEVF